MNKQALHICSILNVYLADIHEPDQLLDELYTLTEWVEALYQQGCKITVFIRFPKEAALERNGVHYFFVKDRYGPQLKFWQVSSEIHRRALAIQPDIFLLHNFNKVLQHYDLLRRTDIPVVIQNHAETPRYWIREQLQKRIFRKVARVLFSAKGQEEIWINKKLFRPEQVNFVMEGSVNFERQDRKQAQQRTGLEGDPVCFWVGNLLANKDPLTVLEGFRRILTDYPQARLYMIYRFGELIGEVKQFIARHPELTAAVTLLGRRQREDLPAYYNSAHYFLQGSHREGSSYSTMEAMACGCVPVITNIPSFRAMTDNGQIGKLWPPGSIDSLETALRAALSEEWEHASLQSRRYFETQLSYPVMSNQVIDCCKALL